MSQLLGWATIIWSSAAIIAVWYAADGYFDRRKESREKSR